MTRETEAALLDFCTRQSADFDPVAWLDFSDVSGDELAATALFLSAVDWYGNKGALQKIAHDLLPNRYLRFSELVSQTRFDCSRFSNMLRRRLKNVPATL